MRRTLITSLSKRITIPQLSPTHTSARIVKILVPPPKATQITTDANNNNDAANNTIVAPYDPILILECSPDLIADPADRISDNHKPLMLIETCDEGRLVWDRERLRLLEEDSNDFSDDDGGGGSGGEWLNVGTVVGVVDDGDDIDGDWLWEAYLHNMEE